MRDFYWRPIFTSAVFPILCSQLPELRLRMGGRIVTIFMCVTFGEYQIISLDLGFIGGSLPLNLIATLFKILIFNNMSPLPES